MGTLPSTVGVNCDIMNCQLVMMSLVLICSLSVLWVCFSSRICSMIDIYCPLPYGVAFCFANVALFRTDFVDTSYLVDLYKTLAHDVYWLGVEDIEEIFCFRPPKEWPLAPMGVIHSIPVCKKYVSTHHLLYVHWKVWKPCADLSCRLNTQ